MPRGISSRRYDDRRTRTSDCRLLRFVRILRLPHIPSLGATRAHWSSPDQRHTARVSDSTYIPGHLSNSTLRRPRWNRARISTGGETTLFYRRFLSLGLKISSNAYPIRMKDSETRAMPSPGGSTHHQTGGNLTRSLLCWRFANMCPHETTDGSDRPRNASADSERIAPGTVNAKLT